MAVVETAAHVLTILSSLTTILVPTAAATGLAATGMVPRLGPARAIALGFYGRFAPMATSPSQRDKEVHSLRTMMARANADQYCVVVGPQGIGKTCIVNTATAGTWGLVHVEVDAGASKAAIQLDVLLAVNRSRLRSYDQRSDAKRVTWWHQLLFRVPPTIVLQAAERAERTEYAELSGACRSLVKAGFKVVVDASHNSFSDAAAETEREQVLDVEPMSRVLVEALHGLEDLMIALREAKLDDVVWAVAGGNPARYFNLDSAFRRLGAAAAVDEFAVKRLTKAMQARDLSLVANAKLAELYAMFVTRDIVTSQQVVSLHVTRPSPDKVLRQVTRNRQLVLEPANHAMALVLRHELTVAPTVEELKLLLKHT